MLLTLAHITTPPHRRCNHLRPTGAQVDADTEMFDPSEAQNIEVIDNGLNGAPAPTERPRITTRYLTKYERARVIGTRALQIRCGRVMLLAHTTGGANA